MEYTASQLFVSSEDKAFALTGPEVGCKRNIAAIKLTESLRKIFQDNGESSFKTGEW